MQARQTFATNGYIVCYHAVPEDKINEWRHMARQKNIGLVWFSDFFDTDLMDVSREHADTPDAESRNISNIVQHFYKTFFPTAEAGGWRFVRTLPGSSDQPVQRDFAPSPDLSQRANACSVPGSMTIVLQDNTYLYGFGWNAQIAMKSDRETIHVNKGDILSCRGDYIHAPVGYTTTHVCLHSFLDVPAYQRNRIHQPEIVPYVDNTRRLDTRFCYAWSCDYLGTGPACVRRHLNRYHNFCFQDPNRTVLSSSPNLPSRLEAP